MVATIAEQAFTVAKIPVSSWSFAIRVWLATILALFVGFWPQLDTPSSTALTVAILAEPTRGQALDKASFRLLATVVGGDGINRNHRRLLAGERSLAGGFRSVAGHLRLCGEAF